MGSEKAQLRCQIINREYFHGSLNLTYQVRDGDTVVSEGVSSSEDWVRHDAVGYHTKEKFDEMYPQGWDVSFDF